MLRHFPYSKVIKNVDAIQTHERIQKILLGMVLRTF